VRQPEKKPSLHSTLFLYEAFALVGCCTMSVDALLPSSYLGCVSGCFATFSFSWLCQWMLCYLLIILAVSVDAILLSPYLDCVSGCFATFSLSWLRQWMLCYLLLFLAVSVDALLPSLYLGWELPMPMSSGTYHFRVRYLRSATRVRLLGSLPRGKRRLHFAAAFDSFQLHKPSIKYV
jgi:hypothetical protein